MKRTCIAVALALGLWLPGAAHALETVRITNIGHGYWAGPLFVAQRLNLFEKHGLKAEVTTVKGGSLSLQTALTKQADVAQVTFEHVLKAASQGKRVVSIYRFAKVPNNSLLANNKIANGVKGASVADRVRALKGARVGVPSAGGSGEKMLQVLANKYGLTLPILLTIRGRESLARGRILPMVVDGGIRPIRAPTWPRSSATRSMRR